MEAALAIAAVAVIVWLALWMRAQRPESNVQKLIQEGRYEEASRDGDGLHRAEALKLLGRFDEAALAYEQLPEDPAAREGLALSLAHAGRELPRARAILQDTLAVSPGIQEFQALSLAYILLRMGRRDEALRLYEDNALLVQTRFEIDYTDADDLLAETLFLYATLAREAGEDTLARTMSERVRKWAPESVFARWSNDLDE